MAGGDSAASGPGGVVVLVAADAGVDHARLSADREPKDDMIGLLGLDYRLAGVELRGRLSFADDRLLGELRALGAERAIDEAVIVSTCNRTEVYVAAPDASLAAAAVKRFLAEAYARSVVPAVPASATSPVSYPTAPSMPLHPTPSQPDALPEPLAEALYELEGIHAARHLFQVAAGLRSMVVGEAQILGQVREALAAAETADTVGDELRLLFTTALKVGKRARTETDIGRADVSVASVAVRVAADSLGGLSGASALLIGAGRTSQLCARLLRDAAIDRLYLANRTALTAADLAAEVQGEAIALAGVADIIPQVQLVISATAAPHTVLSASDIARSTSASHAPLVVIDLAVPPDVDDEVALLPGVSLYTLDSLRGLDDAIQVDTPGRREATLTRAAEIVEEGVHEYIRSRTMRLAVPGISALRRHVDRSEQAELSRALAQLGRLSDEDRAIVERFGQRLVDKMFHHLVSRIRSLAEYDELPPDVTMRVLTELFADPDDPRRSDD